MDRPAPLTVRELIHSLQLLPLDMRVFVDGYEMGVDNAAAPVVIPVISQEWVEEDNQLFGRFEEVGEGGLGLPDTPESLKVVLISRHSR